MMVRYVAICMGLAAVTAAAQEKVLENPWVCVYRFKQAPGAAMPAHQHPAAVAVYLTDARQRITSADGKAQVINHKAGDVAYFEAGNDGDENLSDRAVEMIAVELKPGAPKSPRIALDPVKLDPKHHPVMFENDRVRAIRTILEPHLKSPMHQHPHYVVVYLTELHTTMKLADGTVVDNPRQPGEVAWRDALEHQTENIGDHTAVEIQVEIK